MSSLTLKARLLAQFIHYGQTSRNGEPYFNHCERVAENFDGEMRCIAYLHDTIENSGFPHAVQQVIYGYFGKTIIESVKLLTYNKTIPYDHYVLNIYKSNPKLMDIKFSDIIDNTTDNIPVKQKIKYRNTCFLLKQNGAIIPEILVKRLEL